MSQPAACLLPFLRSCFVLFCARLLAGAASLERRGGEVKEEEKERSKWNGSLLEWKLVAV